MPFLAKNGRIELLFNDFVINKNVCNLRCKYCLSNEAPDWINSSMKILEYKECDEWSNMLNKVVRSYNEIFDARILRISGGELFLIKNIEEFINICGQQYEAVQIITNGCFITEERLLRLKNIKNCCIHFSLDGHTESLNSYRTTNPYTLKEILNNIDTAAKMGFYVEIGTVLNNMNTSNYLEFVKYIHENCSGHIKMYPFPVRGKIAETLFPKEKDVECFKTVIDQYKTFSNVLAPKAYLLEVYEILTKRKRTQQCFMPFVSIQLFDDGSLSPCPNSWSVNMANVLNDRDVKFKILNEKIYRLFLQKRPRIKSCRDCYTSMDIVNLYLLGKIKDEELLKIPIFRGERSYSFLVNLKKIIEEGRDDIICIETENWKI